MAWLISENENNLGYVQSGLPISATTSLMMTSHRCRNLQLGQAL